MQIPEEKLPFLPVKGFSTDLWSWSITFLNEPVGHAEICPKFKVAAIIVPEFLILSQIFFNHPVCPFLVCICLCILVFQFLKVSTCTINLIQFSSAFFKTESGTPPVYIILKPIMYCGIAMWTSMYCYLQKIAMWAHHLLLSSLDSNVNPPCIAIFGR